MRIGWGKSRHFEQRAWQLFKSRFLRAAQSPEAQERIDSQLADKVARLPPDDKSKGKLQRVVQQAAQLWAHRSNLRKTDVALLAAALLYFISPLDAIPDVLPGIGYLDDVVVVSAIVGLVARGVSALSSHGKERLEGWLDERTDVVLKRLDETSAGGVHNAVAAVAIGLWGTTTTAAISLAVSTTTGSYSIEWLAYVVMSSALVLVCNVTAAVYYWREYRKLEGVWQQRLRELVASKLTVRHLVMVGVPVLVLIAMGIVRALSSF
jgi:uncharacterized membrane protein YkvA (DUF1232 family)